MRLVTSSLLRGVGFCLALFLTARAQSTPEAIAKQPGFIKSEFIAQQPPTPMSHASTIVQSKDDLLCAWIGGSQERALDVSIWLSRNAGSGWTEPVEVANGVHDKERLRYPCWNPVLFRPRNGPLILFYKEGPSPAEWWGMVMTSDDNGQTWSRPKRLFNGIYGPVRNKPIELTDGTILAGSSVESSGWLVHVERTKNVMREWSKSIPLNSSLQWGAIQPTLLPWDETTIQMLCRTKQGEISQCWSYDRGYHWSAMRSTGLPNPNSAIDSVLLREGRAVLVYNHSDTDRGILNVAVSSDGRKWQAAFVLENEPGAEFSYPAVIQTADRMVHITYTWKKQGIRHVVLDPGELQLQPILNGQWPK